LGCICSLSIEEQSLQLQADRSRYEDYHVRRTRCR
jgi:hypothetical protein